MLETFVQGKGMVDMGVGRGVDVDSALGIFANSFFEEVGFSLKGDHFHEGKRITGTKEAWLAEFS